MESDGGQAPAIGASRIGAFKPKRRQNSSALASGLITVLLPVFDPASPYAGKFSVYDAPIYIADAAVVLMKSKPELNITNPYSLDETQLQAAIDLLNAQKPAVGEYWGDYTKQIDSFTNGNTVIGTTWQVIANVLQGSDVPVEVVKPEEGATGWSDTWMINSKTTVPNCA